MKRGMFGKFVDTTLIAACSLALFGFLWCGDFTIQNGNQDNMLSVTDIMMDDSMNAFTLVFKKNNNPFRQGSGNNVHVCPVYSIVEYLKILKTWNNGSVYPALFNKDKTPLTRNFFISKL